ncbi:prolipoprotein diacylglyceryl transferase [Longispora sp. K20-0274]|uniref:prolipoprotein diacylglyceryl transferase n=1 Tax=Longispora sp. K20-0274 TaxID=3088255 RepID=UPI0039998BC3
MFPTVGHLGPIAIGTHDTLVGLGVLVAAGMFVYEARRRRVTDDRIWIVVAGALVGGAVLSRLGTWLEHLDPRLNASLVEQWMYGNRSILSGLVGAYFGAIVAKRLCGYRQPTGDLFAPAVALGMAVGRVGCLLTEVPGTPTSLPWSITLDPATAARLHAPAGVGLHPSFGYEIIFQLSAFVALCLLRDRITEPGELFKLYVISYALFRFGIEFVRGNEQVLWGLSRPQWFLLLTLPFAALHMVRQHRRGIYTAWRTT